MTEYLIARSLDVTPTTLCTLNCKHCGEFLCTGGVTRLDIPYESVCHDIDVCFDLYDIMESLQVVVGEVYIYADLCRVFLTLFQAEVYGGFTSSLGSRASERTK
jgi:hypothetical protein